MKKKTTATKKKYTKPAMVQKTQQRIHGGACCGRCSWGCGALVEMH